MTYMSEEKWSIQQLHKLNKETVGQDVLRYLTLPELLGHEKETILYFAGRTLARKIDIRSIDDLAFTFHLFRWGKLELEKEKKNKIVFYLMADEIVERMKAPYTVDFRMEAGFIAEALEQITNRATECIESVNERLYSIQFTVHFTD